MNRVVLVGRITRDPELRTSPSGVAFVAFSIAVNRTNVNANGEREADFINCVAFNKQAENLARFIKKGGQIGVEGKFQRGDTVEVVKKDNTAIARGIVNYSAEDVVKISGKHSDEVHVILGSDANDEVIHRDHLSLVEF